MELAPIPGMVGPDVLAAKLVYKVIGYKFNSKADIASREPSSAL